MYGTTEDVTMPFGKYKGQSLLAVPENYLTWLSGQGLHGWLRDAVEAELRSRRGDDDDQPDWNEPCATVPPEHRDLIEHALEAGFLVLARRTRKEDKESRRKLIAARRWAMEKLLGRGERM